MLHDSNSESNIFGQSELAKALVEKSKAQSLRDVVAKACLTAKNSHRNSSVHMRQESRSYKSRVEAPYPTWESLPKRYVENIFIDTMVFHVSVDETEVPVAHNGLVGLPTTVRRELATMLPAHASITVHKQVHYKGQGAKAYQHGKKITLSVVVKSQNFPVSDAWAFLQRWQDAEWVKLPGGAYISLLNFDFTINFPGAVFPTATEEREPIMSGSQYREPKDNIHYNGHQCITWCIPTDPEKQVAYARTEQQELDTNRKYKTMLRLAKDIEIKLYDKFVFLLSTTSVEAPSGNNLPSLGWSTHSNLAWAVRDAGIQEHGWGRLELRVPRDCMPKSLDNLLEFMALAYEEVVPYCHSESLVDTLRWWYDEKATQVALVRWTGMDWNAAIVRSFNTYTGKYQVESLGNATRQEVEHFLLCSKIAHMGLVVYWEHTYSANNYECFEVGATETLPNLEYLRPSKYDRNSCRSKWCKATLEEVGLVNGPFQISSKPTKTEETLKLIGGSNKQPDLTSVKQAQKQKREWVALVKQDAKTIREQIIAQCDGVDWKALTNSATGKAHKFSDAPSTGLVVGCRVNRKGNAEFALANNSGKISYYRANAALESQVRQLAKTQLYRTHPTQFYKGRLSETWDKDGKVLPIYGESRIVVAMSENDCKNNPELQAYEIIFWDTNDFDKYSHIKLW